MCATYCWFTGCRASRPALSCGSFFCVGMLSGTVALLGLFRLKCPVSGPVAVFRRRCDWSVGTSEKVDRFFTKFRRQHNDSIREFLTKCSSSWYVCQYETGCSILIQIVLGRNFLFISSAGYRFGIRGGAGTG